MVNSSILVEQEQFFLPQMGQTRSPGQFGIVSTIGRFINKNKVAAISESPHIQSTSFTVLFSVDAFILNNKIKKAPISQGF